MLLDVSAWWVVLLTPLKDSFPSATPYLLAGQSSRSIKELEYSLTLRPLDTNAANIVAISRYQYARLLPARVVSVISTSYVNHLFIMFLSRFDVWLFKFTCTLVLKSSSKF